MYYLVPEDSRDNRYYELWTTTSLSGPWTQVGELWASHYTLVDNADHWTDNVSHGEILRSGSNQKLEIADIDRADFLIQGVLNGSYGSYWQIPWDCGVIRNYDHAVTPGPTLEPGDCVCDAGCGTRTVIYAPFAKDGLGELCFESTRLGDHIQSYNTVALEVNGVDYTNQYAGVSSITPINGKYYVYYKASAPYAHFEASGTCNAGTQEPTAVPTVAPTIAPTGAPTTEPTVAPTQAPGGVKGDVNNSGTIDIVDSLLIAQYFVGLNPAGFAASNADVNCSSAIDIIDALLVAQFFVGLVSVFPC